MNRIGDVFLSPLSSMEYLAIACDSCGGIGQKEQDILKIDPYYVGYFTTVVALAEMLAIGGNPISIVDTLSVAMEGDGKRIIDGVSQAISEGGLSSEQLITGSTEENIPVTQTAIGVTVIGRVDKVVIEQQKSSSGDVLVVVGLPKMGQQLIDEELIGKKGEIIQLSDIKKLKALPFVHEVVPVGSKGIAYEANVVANRSGLEIVFKENPKVDLEASAGPATCAVLTIDSDTKIEDLNMGLRSHMIGFLR
jgi:hydrogenase maturation factor HypE